MRKVILLYLGVLNKFHNGNVRNCGKKNCVDFATSYKIYNYHYIRRLTYDAIDARVICKAANLIRKSLRRIDPKHLHGETLVVANKYHS